MSGKLKVENGKWKVESGKWKVENGKWKVENGKLKMKSEFASSYTKPLYTLCIDFSYGVC